MEAKLLGRSAAGVRRSAAHQTTRTVHAAGGCFATQIHAWERGINDRANGLIQHGDGTLMTMRKTLPDAATRTMMLATGMEQGMEAGHVRLESMVMGAVPR